MAVVTGLTAEKMLEMADEQVVSGEVNVGGHLILTTRGGPTVDAGNVVGPPGEDAVHPDASETVKGIAEIANQSETDAGADDGRFITPLKLKNYIDGLGIVVANKVCNPDFRLNLESSISGASRLNMDIFLSKWFNSSGVTTIYITWTGDDIEGRVITIGQGGAERRVGQFVRAEDLPNVPHTLSWEGTALGRIYAHGSTPPALAAGPITFTPDGVSTYLVEFGNTSSGGATLSKVNLVPGTVAKPFIPRLITEEHQLCTAFARRHPLPMNTAVSAWAPRTLLDWGNPTTPHVPFWVTKSDYGVVTLEGLASAISAISAGAVIATLPEGFRPATKERYVCVLNGARNSVTIDVDGTIVINGAVSSGQYVSLGNVIFLEASIANSLTWNSVTLLNSFTATGSGWTAPGWAVDAYGDVWLRGMVSKASWTDGLAIFNIPAPYRTSEYQHQAASSGAAYGYVGINYATGDIVGKGSSPAGVTLSLAGVVYSPSSLDSKYALVGAGDAAPILGSIPFYNSWANYGSNNQASGVRKRGDGLVMIRGLIRTGTLGTTAWWVPVGYRPWSRRMVEHPSNQASGTLVLARESSLMSEVIPAGGSNTWISTDGTNYQAGA